MSNPQIIKSFLALEGKKEFWQVNDPCRIKLSFLIRFFNGSAFMFETVYSLSWMNEHRRDFNPSIFL